ncbi:glycosyltransferase [Sporosarcina siberiensis]|uniref:Glycosyltransferase n=1 Tax=Sporosarcina siberiensis TaxID=1365606 RepID=A0ABW4SL80_9BACL
MKVLLLINSLQIGGAEKHVVTTANNLVNNNIEVYVCSVSNKIAQRNKLDERVTFYSLGEDENLSLKKVWRLGSYLKKNKIDIVHSHLFLSDIYNFLSSFTHYKKIKRISTEHSTSSRRKKYKSFGFIQRLIYRRFETIIAISNAVKIHVLKWTGVSHRKLVTIHNGTEIDIKPQKEIIEKYSQLTFRKVRIGTLARLEHRKDLRTSLRSIRYLVYKLGYTDFHYTIYGDGPQRNMLESYANELEINDFVDFPGFQSDINEVIDDIDIHILPSIEEGFGISIIETMARGIPNVGTVTGGIPEIISDSINGYLFNCGDYKELSNKLLTLMKEKEKILEFGIVASEQVRKKYTSTNAALELIEIYKS